MLGAPKEGERESEKVQGGNGKRRADLREEALRDAQLVHESCVGEVHQPPAPHECACQCRLHS